MIKKILDGGSKMKEYGIIVEVEVEAEEDQYCPWDYVWAENLENHFIDEIITFKADSLEKAYAYLRDPTFCIRIGIPEHYFYRKIVGLSEYHKESLTFNSPMFLWPMYIKTKL